MTVSATQCLAQGTSNNKCSATYGGASAASEPETRAVQTRITQLSHKLLALVSVHTFGNYWLYPGGAPVGRSCTRNDDNQQQVQQQSYWCETSILANGNVCITRFRVSNDTTT